MSKNRTDVEEMKDFIQKTMNSLGAEVKFDPDEDLSTYRCGKPLTAGQLRAMPDGTVVWWRYGEHDAYAVGNISWRHNGPMRITKVEEEDGLYSLSDGSSFGGEFSVGHLADDQPCEEFEYGDDRLYEAVKR